MRTGQLLQRYELFVAAAAIGAHAAAPEDGFRQRDIRFLLELFTNWVEYTLPGGMLPLKNTQISRYLEDLAVGGYARKLSRGKQPRYRLTRLGLLELLSRMSDRRSRQSEEHFFCLIYFLHNYAPRIADLIRAEGTLFPPALRVEIEALLDVRTVIADEISDAEKRLRMLRTRTTEAHAAGQHARKLLAAGEPIERVAAEQEKRFPYGLNSQKPLRALLAELPPDIARWELEFGHDQRAEQIFEPSLKLLERYVAHLRSLAERFSSS